MEKDPPQRQSSDQMLHGPNDMALEVEAHNPHIALNELRENPGEPVELQGLGPQQLPFDDLDPAGSNANYLKLASLKLGELDDDQMPTVDIWTARDSDGNPRSDRVFVAQGGVDVAANIQAMQDSGFPDGIIPVPLGSSLTIGRSQKDSKGRDMNEVLGLDDMTVSRNQIEISITNEGISIEDLDSANGTRLVAAPKPVEEMHPAEAEQLPIKDATNTAETEPTHSETEEYIDSKERALQEVKDQWQLPEDTTHEQIIGRIGNAMEQLQQLRSLTSADSDLSGSLQQLTAKLRATLEGGGRVHYTGPEIEQIQNGLSRLSGRLQEELPISSPRFRTDLAYNRPELAKLTVQLNEAAPSPQGFVNGNSIGFALRILQGDPIGSIDRTLTNFQAELLARRTELAGTNDAEANAHSETTEFANNQIAELAETLRRKDASEDEINAAIITMERAIDTAINNRANPLEYPDGIVDNRQVNRQYGPRQENAETSSRRITAEYAVDILLGNFDASKSADAITIKAGRVNTGQKRAAALMTLYGKNWVEQAEKLGFKVETN